MKAIRFRIQNFRNIDDSDWIDLNKVTCFVGRNESGKTSLLKALHKFNPATPELYDAQREFPRDRYTRDFVANGSKGEDWPVCSVEFEFPQALRTEIEKLSKGQGNPPQTVIATRYYDGSLEIEYSPVVEERPLPPEPLIKALGDFASGARRLAVTETEQEEDIQPQRAEMAKWATAWKEELKVKEDLHGIAEADHLTRMYSELEDWSNPHTAELVESLQTEVELTIDTARMPSFTEQIDSITEQNLPVLIYFENYGILESAIWLRRFREDLHRIPNDSRIRTINSMFKHVGLDANDIAELGDSKANRSLDEGEELTSEEIADDQKRMEERAIKLNSASIDISNKFSNWWSQRRHKIHYHADGDYFRIWIADDRRQDVEIELEARSKGFQWFFSFYLVFLVESDGGHRDAILLLDEPGLHLHPTAQQELIAFFEELSETNQIAYTTHSPFLIDGQNLFRVRPVKEDETGHSRITAETWPKDRETIFPLQAAAGYAMIRGLFRHRKNVLVEGMSDFYYLHALSQQCANSGRHSLPDDIYITPCGGTKLVGHFASLFLGHEVQPLIVLDGDEAGRIRKDALMRELYVNHESSILMLDEVLNKVGQEVEIEDIIGEETIVEALEVVLGGAIKLESADRSVGSLPSQIKAAAERQKVILPKGWKAVVALHLVSTWAESAITLSDEILNTAESLFSTMAERFQN